MNRKLLWLLALLPFVASCADGGEAKRVGIYIYDSRDTFMASIASSLSEKLSGIEHYFSYAEREQYDQTMALIEAIEDDSVGALVLNMVDRMASSAIIEKARLYDKPIVFVNRKPLDEDLSPRSNDEYASWVEENCFYVGTEPRYEGLLQAQIAHIYLEEHPEADKNGDGVIQVGILKGELGHQDTEERTLYCVEGLRERGYQVETVFSSYCNWERDTAKDAMASLTNLSEVELLFSNNDDMALGAIDYLLESGGETDDFAATYFPIVGVDATEPGQQAIRDGYLFGTVINNASLQAEVVGRIIRNKILGEPLRLDNIYELETVGNFYYVRGQILLK